MFKIVCLASLCTGSRSCLSRNCALELITSFKAATEKETVVCYFFRLEYKRILLTEIIIIWLEIFKIYFSTNSLHLSICIGNLEVLISILLYQFTIDLEISFSGFYTNNNIVRTKFLLTLQQQALYYVVGIHIKIMMQRSIKHLPDVALTSPVPVSFTSNTPPSKSILLLIFKDPILTWPLIV